MKQTFSLQPFPSNQALPNIKIAGNIDRDVERLTICYNLTGNLDEVAIALRCDMPARKHELWQDTCLEFFLGIEKSDRYWEFNLSPAGHWNVYRFDGYRQGMQEETTFERLPFNVESQSDLLRLVVEIELSKIMPKKSAIALAITAVIKDRNGEVTYWALTHKGTEADFHRRDSFILKSD
jgi:hypothetical protein